MIKNKINFTKLLVHTILVIGVILTVIPFIWMILTSLKTMGEATTIPPRIFPDVAQWNHYTEVQKTLPFLMFYKNTIIYTLVTVIGQVAFCAMAAYAFARINFPGRDLLFVFLLSVLMVPGQVFLLPQYLIIQKLGLLNTIPALILPSLFSAFGTFLMRQFFMFLPLSVVCGALSQSYHVITAHVIKVVWKLIFRSEEEVEQCWPADYKSLFVSKVAG